MLAHILNEITGNFKPAVKLGTIPDIRSADEKKFLERSKDTLAHLEKIRLDKLEIFEFRKKIGIPAAAILTPICGYLDYLILLWQRGNDDSIAGITLLVIGALYYWVTKPKREYTKAYKQKILPQIAELFGDLRYALTGKISMSWMSPSKIVPGHDRYTSEDYFTGEYKGVDLEFSEIHLEERRRSNKKTHYVTIFKGLAILLNTRHKRFFGHTIIQKDQKSFMEWFKEKSSSLERAELVDPEFEDIFDVYTNDQVDARYLIDPTMIERLKGLYTEYDGKDMSGAFFDNKMLILIASKHNHFEPAGIYVPAANPTSILNMKKEVGEILSIIDKLSLYDPDEVHKQATN